MWNKDLVYVRILLYADKRTKLVKILQNEKYGDNMEINAKISVYIYATNSLYYVLLTGTLSRNKSKFV